MLLNDKFIECYTCGKKDHKSTKCFKSSNKWWCINCKSSIHGDKTCLKSKDKTNKTNDFTDEHSFAFKIGDNSFQLPCEKTFLVDCDTGTQIFNNEENFIDFDESFDPT